METSELPDSSRLTYLIDFIWVNSSNWLHEYLVVPWGGGSAALIHFTELLMTLNRCFAFKGQFNFLTRLAPCFPEHTNIVKNWNVVWHEEWNFMNFFFTSWVIQPNLTIPTFITTGRAYFKRIIQCQKKKIIWLIRTCWYSE